VTFTKKRDRNELQKKWNRIAPKQKKNKTKMPQKQSANPLVIRGVFGEKKKAPLF
jgi:hypothetical protein